MLSPPTVRHLLIPGGILDLTDGSVAHAADGERVPQMASRQPRRLEPGLATCRGRDPPGPGRARPLRRRGAGAAATDSDVLVAGWRDDTHGARVRTLPLIEGAAFDIVTRGLTDKGWTTVGTVRCGCRQSRRPRGCFGDAARRSLPLRVAHGCWSSTVAAAACWWIRGRVSASPFSGAARRRRTSPGTAATRCGSPTSPCWPSGGLHRPGNGTTVFALRTASRPAAWLSPAMSSPAPPRRGRPGESRCGAWHFRPGWALVLIAAAWFTVWSVIALRRSRRHGEDFLPMVLRLPF